MKFKDSEKCSAGIATLVRVLRVREGEESHFAVLALRFLYLCDGHLQDLPEGGVDSDEPFSSSLPPSSLPHNAHYDQSGVALGADTGCPILSDMRKSHISTLLGEAWPVPWRFLPISIRGCARAAVS